MDRNHLTPQRTIWRNTEKHLQYRVTSTIQGNIFNTEKHFQYREISSIQRNIYHTEKHPQYRETSAIYRSVVQTFSDNRLKT